MLVFIIFRETWGGRNRGRGDYRGPMRDRYSPGAQRDLSPPVKRMRPPDWLVKYLFYNYLDIYCLNYLNIT